jgi:hypothetical protein
MSEQARLPSSEHEVTNEIRIYEAPTLTVIGPLNKITLGSMGSMSDGFNMLKK